MSLVYLTGVSGSGKSTILEELKSRGYEAHGTDEHGFGKWVNKKSGIVEIFHENKPGYDIHEWYKEHDWTLDEDKIAKLKSSSDKTSSTVFLCGAAHGEDKVWHLYDKVIALIVDDHTIRDRIKNRTNNHFGKTDEELSHILDWNSGFEDAYRGFGATLVDGTQPVDKVVEEILACL